MDFQTVKVGNKKFLFSKMTFEEKWARVASKLNHLKWDDIDGACIAVLQDVLVEKNLLIHNNQHDESDITTRDYIASVMTNIIADPEDKPYPVFAITPNNAGWDHFRAFEKTSGGGMAIFTAMKKKLKAISQLESYKYTDHISSFELDEFIKSSMLNMMVDHEFWKPAISARHQLLFLPWQVSLLPHAFPEWKKPTSAILPVDDIPVGYICRSVKPDEWQIVTFSVFDDKDDRLDIVIDSFIDYYKKVNNDKKRK